MKNITGFIVEVSSKNQKSIEYIFDGSIKILNNEDKFIGYFWQITEKGPYSSWDNAYIHEVILINNEQKLFKYGGETIFDLSKVNLKIKAKRGPESNNKYLPSDYDKYETWNQFSK